jgi:glycosyltransferase involved in cell wall biosynthesis
MRVLILTIEAFGGLGGIAKYSRDLSRALIAWPGCDEVVVVPRLRRLDNEAVPDGITQDDRAIGGKFRFLVRCLRWLVFGGRFDVIVCGHLNLLPFAALWRLRLGPPVMLAFYGIDAWQPHRSALVNRLVRRAAYFLTISIVTRDRFLAWARVDPARGFILPPCIDIDCFGPGPKPPALVSRYGLAGKRVLLLLGRMEADERLKGFDEMIEALASLVADDPSLVCVFAGDGGDRDRLQRLAERRGVAGHVVFTGMVAEAEKVDHYRLADAFVMPSRGEGFGIVLLEALACGIPVVASRLDGGAEALRDGEMGILVDPDDPEELKKAIGEALARPRGVVPEGLAHFSFERFEQGLHRIFDRLSATGWRGTLKQ